MPMYEYADVFEQQLQQKWEREMVSYELTQSHPEMQALLAMIGHPKSWNTIEILRCGLSRWMWTRRIL